MVWAVREVPLPFLDQHGNIGTKGMSAQPEWKETAFLLMRDSIV